MKPKRDALGADIFIMESTGREIDANCCILGISPNLDIYEGYDGNIDIKNLVPSEREEMADYMIGLWTKFKKGEDICP